MHDSIIKSGGFTRYGPLARAAAALVVGCARNAVPAGTAATTTKPSATPSATYTRCGVVGAMCPVDNGDTGGYPPPPSSVATELRAGPVTVLYGVTDHTTVAFTVENPSTANLSARFRVTLFLGGKRVARTDGSDTVAVAGRADKPVVLSLDDAVPDGVKPDRAEVTLSRSRVTKEPLPATGLSTPRFGCSRSAECTATADLTYTGQAPIGVASIDVQLVDKTGIVRGAGRLTPSTHESVLRPGRTAVSGHVLCPACASGAVDIAGLTVNFAVEPER